MSQPFDRRMLEALICPVTQAVLSYDAEKSELISKPAKLAFPIRDGIPIMLVSEARAARLEAECPGRIPNTRAAFSRPCGRTCRRSSGLGTLCSQRPVPAPAGEKRRLWHGLRRALAGGGGPPAGANRRALRFVPKAMAFVKPLSPSAAKSLCPATAVAPRPSARLPAA